MFPRSTRLFGLLAALSTVLVFGAAAPVSAADPPGWTSEVVAPTGVARAHLPGVELKAARDGRLIAVAVRATADQSPIGLTILERSAGATGTWRLLAKTSWSDVSPSLAVSSGGSVNVAFVRQGSGLRFTSNKTGAWRVEVIPGGSTAQSASLALTNGGTPSVAYTAQTSRTNTAIRIASKTVSGWTTRTIATGDVAEPSLKIDQWSKRHVVFVRRSGTAPGLYYATDRSGTWSTVRIASGRDVSAPRLVLDLARHVHVVYLRSRPVYAPDVMHVTNASGVWRTATASFPAGGSSPDITLDAANAERPVIAYVATSASAPILIAEQRADGAWPRTQATSDDMAGRPGVALVGTTLHVLGLRPFADLDGELIHTSRP